MANQKRPKYRSRADLQEDRIFVTRVTISIIVLVSSILIILTNLYPDSYAKYAFTMVGLIVGYWLR